jgi:hypothetical protein
MPVIGKDSRLDCGDLVPISSFLLKVGSHCCTSLVVLLGEHY